MNDDFPEDDKTVIRKSSVVAAKPVLAQSGLDRLLPIDPRPGVVPPPEA